MKNKWIYFIGIVLIIIIYLFIASIFRSSISNTLGQDKKLQVNASFYPLYYFASQIGGDKAYVNNITPSGFEPHDYEPTTKDIARIEKGNMLVLNGKIEPWEDRIKQNLKGKNVKIVVAGEKLITIDPHIWLDPKLAKKEVYETTQGFISVDLGNKAYYVNNGKMLDNKLDQLDAYYKKELQNCKNKDIVTSHSAFGYLTARYGLNQVTITGLSPDEEPSAKKLAEIAKFAKEHNVKYIFFESLVSPRLSETIANEIGAKTLVLDPIEGLSDDKIRMGKNYFTIMEDNLKNLKIALQCNK